MNVSACLVTRGNVDMQDVIGSLPNDWEIVIWDNGKGTVQRSDGWAEVCTDLSVYGRYAAIEYASHDLIYVQDDDVIVSDPRAIVNAWIEQSYKECREAQAVVDGYAGGASDPLGWRPSEAVVCNMPQEFRPHYPDSALVGFGAAFHRDAPERSFQRWGAATMMRGGALEGETTFVDHGRHSPFFHRTCDVVFTTLTPGVLVDVPKVNLPHATGGDRMYRQPEHVGERARMLDLARRVRES